MDRLDDYDYHLPADLVATRPLDRRDASRLLVVRRDAGRWEHRRVAELPKLLWPGDSLVLNDTQVLPARIVGRRTATGGRWEGLFLGTNADGTWNVIGQTRGRLHAGESVTLAPVHPELAPTGAELVFELLELGTGGVWRVRPSADEPPPDVLARFGTMPLPPYIGRDVADAADWERYQTVYASRPGAVAAPTAGLHLTPELLAECELRGIGRATVTLHVGIGTFRPIQVENLDEHRMHAEWCELSPPVAEQLRTTRQSGSRVVAVGTTTVRTLETAAASGEIQPFCGETDVFLRPGVAFRGVDAMLTNFHLPRSSLLVLVAAFAGLDLTRAAYAEAVRERYRFYSYGDAMLIV
jgi:S-adenosylmethionine:tRNA ribosyltransferase-isomerase